VACYGVSGKSIHSPGPDSSGNFISPQGKAHFVFPDLELHYSCTTEPELQRCFYLRGPKPPEIIVHTPNRLDHETLKIRTCSAPRRPVEGYGLGGESGDMCFKD
jgi:hypothetical protein